MPLTAKINIDWTLVAAIAAAPICWWIMSLTVTPAKNPDLTVLLSQRFLMVVILYPVLEEIVFRGWLQGWIRRQSWGARSLYGISNANVLTSVVFTFFHLARRFSFWSTTVMLPSMVFGFFRDRYGTLYVPIALHIFYNAGIVLLFPN